MEPKFKEIQKRDGRVVAFDQSKIAKAIFKALEAVGEPNFDLARELSLKVVQFLNEKLPQGAVPKVEQIQDAVEQVLVEEGQAKVAKHYILYRQNRSEIRQQKQQVLQKEEIDEVDKNFDLNALRVLCSRYLRKDEDGKVAESPKELFERVALHVALPSLFYDEEIWQKRSENYQVQENLDFKKYEGKLKIGRFVLNRFHFDGLTRVYQRFNSEGKVAVKFSELLKMLEGDHFAVYEQEAETYIKLMVTRKFFPNTPTLANFGSHLGMGSACFALAVEDSIESIMGALSNAAIIFKSGGGVGYNFSKLRPAGDFIKTTGGVSSGPISFMSLFDKMSDVIKQGGIRRGASMGILNINHPDIDNFITAKRGNQALRNFNISVMIKPEFWEYYEKKEPYPLINPKNNQPVKYADPQSLLNLIVYQAWESAEPGVLFEDTINKNNPFLESLGPIQCTNPCVVGDTLVALADGRDFVPIKQLAQEGKNVPVYSFGQGKVSIKMGRNPRLTRKKAAVWKVVLDDSSHIIATPDHKFRNRDNQEVKLSDLVPGMSLMPFYKFNSKDAGWAINLNNGAIASEDSLVKEWRDSRKEADIFCNTLVSREELLSLHNHKVRAVAFYGYEDVYNITVDDFHTVAYITNPHNSTKFTKKPLLSGIITSNCGELPLYPDESCNLGSINVWSFCKSQPTNGRKKAVEFDWDGLRETVMIATKFLDNVIDVNNYPLPQIEDITLKTRKIGLGIMGLGDLLFELEIPYNSSEGLEFMEQLMEFINYHSKLASIELAKQRGKFPYYRKTFYADGKLPITGPDNKEKCRLDWESLREKIKQYGLRHSQTTTNAPTGSISMIAGCSSGIEPVFSLVFEKEVAIGSFYYVDSVFEKAMEREGLFDDALIKEVSDRGGTLQGLSYVSQRLKKIFTTAMDIDAKDHIKALAILQKWTDSSISKTINFPSNATVDDMKNAYLLGYKMGCKGVTMFRDKSIKGVLNTEVRKDKSPLTKGVPDKKSKEPEVEMISLKDDKAKGPGIYLEPGVASVFGFSESNQNDFCPKCKCALVKNEGCKKCPQCGWGLCTG